MSFLREQDHDSSSCFDSNDVPAKAAGKRTLTEGLMSQGQGAAAGAPRTLTSSAAPAGPDPFDFSFARPLAANDQDVEAEVTKCIETGDRNVNSITDHVFYRVHPEQKGQKRSEERRVGKECRL